MTRLDKRIAIVVDPALPLGLLANTVATIAVGLGAAEPGFGDVTLTDAAGRSVKTSADRPVAILQASPETIRALLVKALPPPAARLSGERVAGDSKCRGAYPAKPGNSMRFLGIFWL